MYEFFKFVSARVVTMIIEVVGVYCMTEMIHMNDFLSKFVIQFIVLILNYIFSKFLVFRNKK
jgi:putative flippase GtrA